MGVTIDAAFDECHALMEKEAVYQEEKAIKKG
jgi:hypothetical protein